MGPHSVGPHSVAPPQRGTPRAGAFKVGPLLSAHHAPRRVSRSVGATRHGRSASEPGALDTADMESSCAAAGALGGGAAASVTDTATDGMESDGEASPSWLLQGRR